MACSGILGLKNSDLILRSAASLRRVSKDGRSLGRGLLPSFETAAQEGGLLRMRSFVFSQALQATTLRNLIEP